MPEGSEFHSEGVATLKTEGVNDCVDPRNRQQIGVGRAYRTCRDVVAKRVEVSWLRGVDSVMSLPSITSTTTPGHGRKYQQPGNKYWTYCALYRLHCRQSF